MMTVDEYQRWKDDPLTVKFHKFLRDYRQSLMEKWAVGELQDKEELCALGRCQLADDLAGLDDNYIQEFYRQTKEAKGSDDDREQLRPEAG